MLCFTKKLRKDSGGKERNGMDVYQRLNEVLVNLFHEVKEKERREIITGEFQEITENDMHMIEVIGQNEGCTMSELAKKMGLTAGTVTTAVNGLVKKAYVVREKSERDRRVVYVFLTEKGKAAFLHHASFHKKMMAEVLSRVEEEELPVLEKMLEGLLLFFREDSIGCG